MSENSTTAHDGFSDETSAGGGVKERPKYFRFGMPPSGQTETKRFRIFPPYKNGRAKKINSLYTATHFGVYQKGPKDDKPRMVTFACVQEKRNGAVTTHCPMCDKIEDAKYKADMLEKDLIESARNNPPAGTEVTLAEAKKIAAENPVLSELKAFLKSHNVSKKWRFAAKAEDGSFGFLDLGYEHKEALLAAAASARNGDEGPPTDPFSFAQGVWFVFGRKGETFNALKDTCEILKEKVKNQDGSVTSKIVPAPLTKEEGDHFLSFMPSLDESLLRLTPLQVKAVVDCKEDPEVVAKIVSEARGRDDAPDVEVVSTVQRTKVVNDVPEIKPQAPVLSSAERAAILAQSIDSSDEAFDKMMDLDAG